MNSGCASCIVRVMMIMLEISIDLCLRSLIVVIVHELWLKGAPGHLIPVSLFLLLANFHIGLLPLAGQALSQGQALVGGRGLR